MPQLGSRRCSLRAKGAVLDPIITTLTSGQPYRHYLGFETGELRRAQRDTVYNTATRYGVYPLLDWQWSRTDAPNYLEKVTKRRWQKSACSYCPFQFSSKAGRADALERYRRDPDAGVHALYLEHVAACLNPRQSLLVQGRLIDLVTHAGLTEVLGLFAEHLAVQQHALYEVRRLDTGAAAALHATLMELPADIDTTPDGITRAWRHRRGTAAPWAEHFYVVAPSTAIAHKQRPGFEALYARATGAVPTLVA